jgi:HSP20 family protein
MSIDRRQTGNYLPLRDAMERLFAGSFIAPQSFEGGFPATDVSMTEDEVVVCMAVPGARPDDINVSVTGDTITISGDIKHSHKSGGKGSQTFINEVWSGQFHRSFTLPIAVDADKAEATFENGILTVTIPKSAATRPRKIQVKHQQQTLEGQTGQSSGQSSVQKEEIPVQSS